MENDFEGLYKDFDDLDDLHNKAIKRYNRRKMFLKFIVILNVILVFAALIVILFFK
jgi:hypothetical protein